MALAGYYSPRLDRDLISRLYHHAESERVFRCRARRHQIHHNRPRVRSSLLSAASLLRKTSASAKKARAAGGCFRLRSRRTVRGKDNWQTLMPQIRRAVGRRVHGRYRVANENAGVASASS